MAYHHELGPSYERPQTTRRGHANLSHHQNRHTAHPASANHVGQLLLGRTDFQIRLADHHCSNGSDLLVDRMYSRRGYRVNTDGAGAEHRLMSPEQTRGTKRSRGHTSQTFPSLGVPFLPLTLRAVAGWHAGCRPRSLAHRLSLCAGALYAMALVP